MSERIPFYPNTGDGTHCYQAALKMALAPFDPKNWTYEELNKICDKQPGKWTWPTASFLWLLEQGYEVRLVEEFDYRAFAKKGYEYLLKKSGKEVADAQKKNSSLSREQKWAKRLVEHAGFALDDRIPTWEDLKSYRSRGYSIICNVNSCKLYKQPGYSGHFVVPVSVEETSIILHDPGLPAKPSQTVLRAVFEEAWGYPTDHEKNLVAIRKEG